MGQKGAHAPGPKGISTAEFVKAYRDLQSSSAVAAHFGISVSVVNRRRRRLQKDEGIVLPQFDTRAAYNRATTIDESRAICKLQITDGCVLVGSDIHIWPGLRTTMQRAFIHFARKLKPVAVIANGDVFDGASISRHARIGWESQPTVKQELEAVQDFMGDLVKAAGSAKRIWNLGNHDARFESRLAAVAPEFAGVKGIHLRDHFEQWIPAWRTDINVDGDGKPQVVVKHRGLGGEHADWNNVMKGGVTMVTGHDHRANVTPYRDYRGRRWGVRCGYMAESPLDPQFVNYLEASAPNWEPAFVVLSFRNGRLLWPELVIRHEMEEDRVEFRGEVIEV